MPQSTPRDWPKARFNLHVAALYEEALRRGEGSLSSGGPLCVLTGERTGRSPNDKFLVAEPGSEKDVWWGEVNRRFDPEKFDVLEERVRNHLEKNGAFVQESYAGADPEYRLRIRVAVEYAWHSIFARNMFRIPHEDEYAGFEPDFTILCAPSVKADPARDGTNSEAFVLLHLGKRMVVIGGTEYSGEIKKSVFTILHYLLPKKGVLSMHCSANIGPQDDVACFFGLSGTGKTTLSADPTRRLIGDDEHGWSDTGVFNFEGGCYAKVIRISGRSEPEIFQTTHRFGTILENVVLNEETRRVDLDDDRYTENTRASYPLRFIANHVPEGMGGHPRNIIFLAADAFGVMPPLSRLSPEQAMFHFLSGYTAKVAGTERGVKEPKATFSTCFAAPFLVLQPAAYAKLLGEKIARHEVRCWLVNTGWTGGPYGVGSRMDLPYTRAMLQAALDGKLESARFAPDPVFGVDVPVACPGVPDQILHPKKTWKDGAAYDQQAKKLTAMFRENFKKFEGTVSPAVREACP